MASTSAGESGKTLSGAGLGVGGNLEDEGGGAEAEGGGGTGRGEGGLDGIDGLGGEEGGLFVPVKALFAGGEFEFAGEGGDGASPVADGVAVDVFFGGGLGDGLAGSDPRDDAVLKGRERGVG